MQAWVAVSVYAGSLQPVYGPMVLRAVAKHFEMHFDLLPTNFVIVLPTVASHFCSNFVGSVTCAGTDAASRHSPDAAIAALPNHPTITVAPPCLVCWVPVNGWATTHTWLLDWSLSVPRRACGGQ